VAQARPGQRLRPEPVADLIELLEAARAAGFKLEVRSAYRSYIDQEATFEKWVAYELRQARQNGQPISRATAMERASAYSAAPGKSEHQTGLAVDLLPTGAPDIGFIIPADLQVWLASNAHLYGWVQSYPVKTDQAGYSITAQLTGYTSEPWHWRWQGRAAASDLFERGYLDPAGPALPPALPLICDLDHDPCAPLAP
jgi:D-alanyl-D-alanine carboxypeptidase